MSNENVPKVKVGDKVIDSRYPNSWPMTVHKIHEETGQVLMGKTDDFVELREWHKVLPEDFVSTYYDQIMDYLKP